VYILNDCQAAAIGELTYGKDFQTDNNLVLINVHHGIGSGIIINREIFQGDGGFAGEIGHIVVVPEGGVICRCGKRGCLETVASARALTRQAKELIQQYPDSRLPRDIQHINLDTLEEAFTAGDPLVHDLVLKSAEYLGMAISNIVGILNIQKIVLEGDMTRFGAPWVDKIREVVMRYSLDRLVENTDVKIGHLGENAIILGATAVFANNYSYLFNEHLNPAQPNY
jgi:predicted NBD/HSP70 family sugar kinase